MQEPNPTLAAIMEFISGNIAYILLGVGVLYFVILIGSFVYAKKHGGEVTIHLKYIIPFALIIGLGVYCLVTGQDISTFLG